MQKFKSSALRLGAACSIAALMISGAIAADLPNAPGADGRPEPMERGQGGPMRGPMDHGPGGPMMGGPMMGGPMMGGPMMGGPRGAEGQPLPPFLHGVVLSEAQQDKVFQIMYALVPQMRQLHKAGEKAHEGLQQLASAAQFDEAKAKTLAEAEARAFAEMSLLRARSEQQIRALLTPEQRKAAEARKPRGPQAAPAPR